MTLLPSPRTRLTMLKTTFFSLTVLAVSAVAVGMVLVFCTAPIFWTLPAALLTGTAAAGGIALVNSIGNLGGFFGPLAIGSLKEATGSYAPALWVLAAGLAGAAAIVLGVARGLDTRAVAGAARAAAPR